MRKRVLFDSKFDAFFEKLCIENKVVFLKRWLESVEVNIRQRQSEKIRLESVELLIYTIYENTAVVNYSVSAF